jgi:LysM repeat protein/ABC-type branched-subunit amino acid transport system substrate-binding protein
MKQLVIICLTIFLAFSTSVSAQKEVEISGVKYILHSVTKSETVFSLCQKYHVTPNDIQAANPGLNGILRVGSTVKIPVGKVEPEQKKTERITVKDNDQEYYYHKVAKEQTLFSIAKQYEITANDVVRYNPEASNGIQIGQVLKIPVKVTKSSPGIVEVTPSVEDDSSGQSKLTVHQVVSGETLYSLEQKYGVSHQEMMKANPALAEGLKAGMKLMIPAKSETQIVQPVLDSRMYTKYKVEKGETLFSLSNRFGVEVSELKRINPSLLSRSLETGEIILIPNQGQKKNENFLSPSPEIASTDNTSVPQSSDCLPISAGSHALYKVGLLLPFYLPELPDSLKSGFQKSLLLEQIRFNSQILNSNTDTASVAVNGTTIESKAYGFLDFYEGALLALDSLRQLGMNVELYTFDASNQAMITRMLQMEEFMELNLIIGPVYPELQSSVASFAAKNRIPMVSPLSAMGNFEQSNSWYFKVNPTKEYQTEQTARYIASEYSDNNLFLLQFGENSVYADARLSKLCKEKMDMNGGNKLFHEYNFQKSGVNEIKPLLKENEENIFILPTDYEAQVSVTVTNLTALAEHYDIVLVGSSNLVKLKSVQTENYHRVQLRYLSPYFINYERPVVRRFVAMYRDVFSGEPSQFSFQGFDVSYYFLSALFHFGKDFRNCLQDFPMELMQMSFNFKKLGPMSGNVNTGLFINAYQRNYDITNLGLISGN